MICSKPSFNTQTVLKPSRGALGGFRRKDRGHSEGSALLVTLLVISLLLIMTLTFVTVVRMELRSVTNHQQELQARSHARLAMELAIGELQLRAGADQRVTSTAAASGNTTHPHWTGVWYSSGVSPATMPDAANENPAWLVSGGGTPDQTLNDGNSIVLVPSDPDDAESVAVRAPLVEMPATGSPGRMGWWVGDEGVKARVDVVRPEGNPATLPRHERNVFAQIPGEPDILSLGNPWNQGANANLFARGENQIRNRLISRDTLGMAVQEVPIRTLIHDLTVHGYGIPVNVRDGGLKADWSVILDRSMENTALVDHYMGARPTQNPPSG